jgi:hypothetical protein
MTIAIQENSGALILNASLSNIVQNPNPMFNGNMVLLYLHKWTHGAENKT